MSVMLSFAGFVVFLLGIFLLLKWLHSSPVREETTEEYLDRQW